MAITPTGSPVWVRANDYTTYGCNFNKIDYQSIGPVNPRTDIGASEFCRMTADVASVGNTAPFASLQIQLNDTSASPPTILSGSYLSMAGGVPVAVRNGNGDISVTWSESYLDQYNVPGLINIIHAEATVNGNSAAIATVELLDPTATGRNESVQVRVFDTAGAAAIDSLISLVITTGPV